MTGPNIEESANNILAFLNERLDEEERWVNSTIEYSTRTKTSQWQSQDEVRTDDDDDETPAGTVNPWNDPEEYPGWTVWAGEERFAATTSAYATWHIETYDPARIQTEITAKRALINSILTYEETLDGEFGCGHTATQIRNGECPERHPNNIAALQALASPYRFKPQE